ncbi:MAG TPA: hypothetical protein VHV83_11030 [Armatimonadota bacterium]|nr:hypothetical protein [Armatimonadota bacterium]
MTLNALFPGNVRTCCEGFASRRDQCLSAVAAHANPSQSIFGMPAIARLALGRDVAAANAELCNVAHWFDQPHPTGRDHRGECDFAAIKLCLAYYHPEISALLDDATRTAIKQFFLTQPFDSMYGSENHALLFRVSRYLMALALPQETFTAYGHTGQALSEEDGQWLKDFIRFRAQRGWGEFDSACYLVPDWESLTCLYAYTPDTELRSLCGMMLDLLLADMIVDSLNGMYCGAHGRIYPPQALDHERESTYPLQYLYFGLGDPACAKDCLIDAVLSSYRPHPLLVDIALNRHEPYENRERKHLHLMSDTRPEHPLEGSIRKYTYYTPDYVLGCVQFQDVYPEFANGDHIYAHHQQHQWDFTVANRTDARLFTHHPGDFNEHNYWTGDLQCGCGHFMQSTTALLALYDILPTQPYQFIHAYVPMEAFDEVIEEDGTIFVRAGHVYAALTLLGGCEWVREGEWAYREVISRASKNGAVCEVGTSDDFGTFAAFRAECRLNAITFAREAMRLTYQSRRAGTLSLDTNGLREINGQPLDLEYATYDCPYLHSPWKSGVATLQHDAQRLVLDFNASSASPR